MKDLILAVNSLHVQIAGRDILRDVTFDVKSGEICALLGHNGAGKTVTLKMVETTDAADWRNTAFYRLF